MSPKHARHSAVGHMSSRSPYSHAASSLQRVRRMVLYMVLALGACTLLTAGVLLAHTLEHSDNGVAVLPVVVWSGGSGSGSGSSSSRPAAPVSAEAAAAAAAAAAAKKAVAAAAGLHQHQPLTKELDPDYVEPKAKAAVTYAKRCPAGCTKNGNCNAEEGRCECPFGYVGAVCDVPLFPACKLAPNATEMHCGENMPRSCECFRQCRRFYCGGGKGACETPRDPWYVRCFERPQPAPGSGTPKPAMFSDVPEEWEETKGLMSWHLGIRSDLQRQKLTRQQATKVRPVAPGSPEMYAVPLSQCPDRCMLRGQCIKPVNGAPKCLCWQGYTGPSCESVYKFACVNQCLGRGTCRGGFCHCQPGYWGKDCSRSKAYAPYNAPTAVTGLKIYVYEIPTHLAFDQEHFVGFPGHDPTYIAYKGFNSGLLHDWAVRTENPWEANLFYVPALTYAYSSNLGDVVEHLRRVMAWVRTAHPFFNRTGGRDHFAWLPNDRGACWIDPKDPLLGNMIKLVHFGFHQANTQLPNDFQLMPERGAACFNPSRDVVAAPYSYKQEAVANETYLSPEAAFDPTSIPTDRLLFFAGSIKMNEPDYSGGVRQELWKLAQAKKLGRDVLITDKTKLPNFKELVRSSKFCLAPWGHGWGNRLGLYMAMGCVPVIVQDGVYQPYHDLLPYHKFSVTLPKARLASITQVLSSISDAEYIELRRGLTQHWRAFVWHPLVGGQAYNHTLRSLQARLHNQMAGLF